MVWQEVGTSLIWFCMRHYMGQRVKIWLPSYCPGVGAVTSGQQPQSVCEYYTIHPQDLPNSLSKVRRATSFRF